MRSVPNAGYDRASPTELAQRRVCAGAAGRMRERFPLRRPNFNQRVKWTTVVAKMGLKRLHCHDLRHAGNIWASKAGASTKDLMARMGHDDMRAALIYQRATSDADKRIADRLSKLVDEQRNGRKET